eukprot:CAMPEP_0206186582 /NCGR_PEP_ID=MMETSP0166-20121206/2488_1 /ASSEMBLY_ACC=CAM_ASM_000260 /TAXON_ID=95228 /ORGANISM="Vannella robusta, Strain DIVA3 518/3/11/1/6" /LENGTH=66 /DNA_ID=CAMNT_0053601993 /DNA_START=983 /DNA_END=1180 /DNA_ORIENTATION=+
MACDSAQPLWEMSFKNKLPRTNTNCRFKTCPFNLIALALSKLMRRTDIEGSVFSRNSAGPLEKHAP